MRRVFLDTETTGLSPEKGHRIVEIAAIAYDNRMPVPREEGGVFHERINPEREVEKEAFDIHGLDYAFLSDKPKFAAIAAALADFLRGNEVIIHNADFDQGFLDSEFARTDVPPLEEIAAAVTCSLKWSRENNPNIRGHSLNALCEHFGVNNAARTFHSAMLDTELLAKVYFQMTSRQGTMQMRSRLPQINAANGEEVPVLKATAAENAAHLRFLKEMREENKIVPLFSRPPDGDGSPPGAGE